MVHIELTLPQFTLQLSFRSVIVYIPFEHHNFYHGCYDPQPEAQLFLIAYHYLISPDIQLVWRQNLERETLANLMKSANLLPVRPSMVPLLPFPPSRKEDLNTQFFDATLADMTSSVRLVGFTPQHQIQLNEMHKTNSPVELTNCVVKHSRQGQGFDVMLKSTLQISKKFDMDAIMASTVETKLITLDMLQTLSQYEKVSVHVKILRLLPAEQVGQENKIKRDVIVADRRATAKVGRNTLIHSKKESLTH